MTNTSTVATQPELDAVIVGAGFSGMYALHCLREKGLRVRAYERGGNVGGAWYWNRYPGLNVDTESMSYCFTFSRELYEEWTWSARFSPQPEIEEYARHVAQKFDLRRDIQFNTSVVAAHFDEARHWWRIRLDDGSEVTARYFVSGAGPLSTANVPKVKGIERFKGAWYHTGAWPHDKPVDFQGKRVGVVGTGSSGVQVILAVAEQAERLTVFQRTPQYITPAQNRKLDPEFVREVKRNLEQTIAESRNSSFGAPGAKTDRSVFDDTPAQRAQVFEAAWQKGAQAFALATYRDLTTNEEANQIAADFVRAKIAQLVHDPETARKLMPNYLFGTKRPVKADGYYEVFNRDNVDLVDLCAAPLQEVTENGLRTANGEVPLDILVFATGFDAITGTLFNIDIRGRGGQSLRDKWDNGAGIQTYLGLTCHGFPNMLMIGGPQSPSVLANFLFNIQQQGEWIAELLADQRRRGIACFEAPAEGEAQWTRHCQELADATLLPRTASWWMGGNVDGKPRAGNFPIYLGGVKNYGERLGALADGGYQELLQTKE